MRALHYQIIIDRIFINRRNIKESFHSLFNLPNKEMQLCWEKGNIISLVGSVIDINLDDLDDTDALIIYEIIYWLWREAAEYP